MTIPRFTARDMSAAVRLLGDGRQNFLKNVVFAEGNQHVTDLIDFGKMSIPARVASYSMPGAPATVVNKSTGSSKSTKAPRIREKIVFDENAVATLNPALASYMGPYMDPNAQISEKIALEQAKLRRRIDRAIELQCAQALSTGIITITLEDGTTVTIDLGFDSGTIMDALTGTSLWQAANSKPLGTLEDVIDDIKDGNGGWDGPMMVIMGRKAWKDFQDNAQVQKRLDNRRINDGTLAPVAGANYQGTIGELAIYKYVNGYVRNSDDTRVQAWDANKIAVVPQDRGLGGNASIEYGAVYDTPDENTRAQYLQTDFFSKIRIDASHDVPVEELIVESRPLALIKSSANFRVITVTA